MYTSNENKILNNELVIKSIRHLIVDELIINLNYILLHHPYLNDVSIKAMKNVKILGKNRTQCA